MQRKMSWGLKFGLMLILGYETYRSLKEECETKFHEKPEVVEWQVLGEYKL